MSAIGKDLCIKIGLYSFASAIAFFSFLYYFFDFRSNIEDAKRNKLTNFFEKASLILSLLTIPVLIYSSRVSFNLSLISTGIGLPTALLLSIALKKYSQVLQEKSERWYASDWDVLWDASKKADFKIRIFSKIRALLLLLSIILPIVFAFLILKLNVFPF